MTVYLLHDPRGTVPCTNLPCIVTRAFRWSSHRPCCVLCSCTRAFLIKNHSQNTQVCWYLCEWTFSIKLTLRSRSSKRALILKRENLMIENFRFVESPHLILLHVSHHIVLVFIFQLLELVLVLFIHLTQPCLIPHRRIIFFLPNLGEHDGIGQLSYVVFYLLILLSCHTTNRSANRFGIHAY